MQRKLQRTKNNDGNLAKLFDEWYKEQPLERRADLDRYLAILQADVKTLGVLGAKALLAYLFVAVHKKGETWVSIQK